MSTLLTMSEEEKKKILDKHKQATKSENEKKGELKKGLQKPENKNDKTS